MGSRAPSVAVGVGVMLGIAAGCLATQPSAPATPPPAPAAAQATHAPAARVLTYAVITVGRPAGDAEIRIEPDGRRVTHFSFNDRGRGPDVHSTLVLDAGGFPRSIAITGHDYLKAPIDEQLTEAGGTLAWKSTSEHGHAPAGSGVYISLNDGVDMPAVLARRLLRAPDHRVKLLPAGEAWLDDNTEHTITIAGKPARVRHVAIAGLGFQPAPMWLDADGELLGVVSSWTSIIRTGAESALPTLLAEDQAWAAARAQKLATSLAHRPPAAGLAIIHARLFDSVRKTVVNDATVIVTGDKITAVGTARTPLPAGAQVIDAHGRMLVPGLWDMHVHLADGDGLLHLAAGVTTVRDLGTTSRSSPRGSPGSTPAARSARTCCAPG